MIQPDNSDSAKQEGSQSDLKALDLFKVVSGEKPSGSALVHTPANQRSIGELLLDSKRLSPKDIKRILRLQGKTGLRFGAAAEQLGLLSREDVQHALATQFGHFYPIPIENTFAPTLIAAYRPYSPYVEALRQLRNDLLLDWCYEKKKVLAIVSPHLKEGRSYLAANLAIVFAQLRKRVLLIDADLRNPTQHVTFNLQRRKDGLSTILAGLATEYLPEPVPLYPSLFIIGSGPAAPHPLDLLSGPKFSRIIQRAAEFFDIVIVDTPANGLYRDAASITIAAGSALVVASKRHTHLSALMRLKQQLDKNGITLAGCVLNTMASEIS